MNNHRFRLPFSLNYPLLRSLLSISAAIIMAIVLLFIPLTAKTSFQSPLKLPLSLQVETEKLQVRINPERDRSVDIAVSFGPTLVQATNGFTITKFAPAEVDQGGALTYTFEVSNQTGQPLTETKVIDILPAETTCNATNHAEPDSPIWAYFCDTYTSTGWIMIPEDIIFPPLNNRLADGATSLLTVTLDVNEPLPDGFEIVNNNYRASSNNDLFTDFGEPVTTSVRAPNWAIGKTVSSDIAEPGDFLTYTVTITNDGRLATSGAYTLTDPLPTNTDIDSVRNIQPTGGVSDTVQVTWVLTDPIPPGGTKKFSYAVQVTNPLTTGETVVNQGYSVTGGNVYSAATGSPVTVNVRSPATLSIAKSASDDPVPAGAPLTYTLRVTSEASSKGPAFNVVVTDTVPANTSLLDAGFGGAATGTVLTDTQTVTWTIDTIGVGSTAELTMIVQVDSPLTNGAILTNTYGLNSTDLITVANSGSPLTTTVVSTPTLDIFKVGLPKNVRPGESLTYTIHYTNTGNGNAIDLIIRDTYPISTSYLSGDSDPNIGLGTSTSNGREWTIPALTGEGGSGVITLTLSTDESLMANTVLTNVVSITAADVDVATAYTATNIITGTPSLTITKAGSPLLVDAGGRITYTIRYTNTGDAHATGIIISETFPVSAAFAAESSIPDIGPGSSTPNGRVWNVGSVAGNDGGLIRLTLDVASPQPNGTVLTNVVSIVSAETPTPAIFTTTNKITSRPKFNISLVDTPDPVAVGGILTYTITYSNSGNADAVGVKITNTLAGDVIFNGATGGGIHNNGVVAWTGLSAPANGLNQTVLVTVTVASTVPNGTLVPNSVAIGDGNDSNGANISTLVEAPSLAVTKVVSPAGGFVRAGEAVEYVITYANTGPITASNVFITDTFPISITNIVSESLDAAFQSAAASTYTWLDSEVSPGSSGVITVSGQLITTPWPATGHSILNEVVVSNNVVSDTGNVSIEGQPGLPAAITVAPTPSITQVGNTIRLTITVSDAYGNPVLDGTSVSLSAAPLGALPANATTTDGVAKANLNSTTAGSTTVTVQANGASGVISETAIVTFTPGAVTDFTLQATSPQTVGVSFPITITAIDALGNQVTTFNQSAAVTDTTGTITPLLVNFVNGLTVANVTVFSATSPFLDSIQVISGNVSGSVGVEIAPGPAANVAIELAPSSIRVCGTSFVTTTVTDAYGNSISGEHITMSQNPSVGTFQSVDGNTDSSGRFTTTLLGTAAGASVITASTDAGPSGSASITVNNPPLPDVITVTVSPASVEYNNSATVTAEVRDCGNNPISGSVVTFTIGSLGVLNPLTATTEAGGIATTTVTAGTVAGATLITGTVEGAHSDSASFTVTPPTFPVLTLTKTATPSGGQNVEPGEAITYHLRVTNTGTASATNLVITDTFDGGSVGIVSYTISSGASFAPVGNVITFAVPGLEINSAVTATLEVTVTATASGTTIVNQAAADSAETGLLPDSPSVVHQVITRTVEPVFLPLVNKNSALLPDLTISSLTIDPSPPTSSGNSVVTVIIENQGNSATREGFWVDFYVNPDTLPDDAGLGRDRKWSNDAVGAIQGIAWPVSQSLAPGESLTLTSDGSAGLAPDAAQSTWTGSLPAGEYDFYAFVDSFDLDDPTGPTYVEIVELDETNNMSGPLSVVVTTAAHSAATSSIEAWTGPARIDLGN